MCVGCVWCGDLLSSFHCGMKKTHLVEEGRERERESAGFFLRTGGGGEGCQKECVRSLSLFFLPSFRQFWEAKLY